MTAAEADSFFPPRTRATATPPPPPPPRCVESCRRWSPVAPVGRCLPCSLSFHRASLRGAAVRAAAVIRTRRCRSRPPPPPSPNAVVARRLMAVESPPWPMHFAAERSSCTRWSPLPAFSFFRLGRRCDVLFLCLACSAPAYPHGTPELTPIPPAPSPVTFQLPRALTGHFLSLPPRSTAPAPPRGPSLHLARVNMAGGGSAKSLSDASATVRYHKW